MASVQLGLSFLANQPNNYIPLNDWLKRLDALVLLSVKDRDLSAPPGGPTEGDRYIVGPAATGAWSTKDGKIAVYLGGWVFMTPHEGWETWVDDEDVSLRHDGTNWVCRGTAALQTLADGATIGVWGMNKGNTAIVTLAGTGRTMPAPTGLKSGMTYTLLVKQDGTGSRTITTWNAVFKWPGGTAPTLSAGANALDVFTFFSDGTNLYRVSASLALA